MPRRSPARGTWRSLGAAVKKRGGRRSIVLYYRYLMPIPHIFFVPGWIRYRARLSSATTRWPHLLESSTMPSLPAGLEIKGAMRPGYETVLTADALEFIVELARKFAPRVEQLLAARIARQREIDAG